METSLLVFRSPKFLQVISLRGLRLSFHAQELEMSRSRKRKISRTSFEVVYSWAKTVKACTAFYTIDLAGVRGKVERR